MYQKYFVKLTSEERSNLEKISFLWKCLSAQTAPSLNSTQIRLQ